jgi:hypothetical protein
MFAAAAQQRRTTWRSLGSTRPTVRCLAPLVVAFAMTRGPAAYGKSFRLLETADAPPVPPTVIEGSERHGGLQPDYLLDETTDHLLGMVLRAARRIGQQGHDYWTTVGQVSALVRASLRNPSTPQLRTSYTDPVYRELMRWHRDTRRPVPLGAYRRHRVGVCRENYLYLHLALIRAGIVNDAHYNLVESSPPGAPPDLGDHGYVVLAAGEGAGYIVDTYNPWFHLVRHASIENPEGVTRVAQADGLPARPMRIRLVEQLGHPAIHPITGDESRRFLRHHERTFGTDRRPLRRGKDWSPVYSAGGTLVLRAPRR